MELDTFYNGELQSRGSYLFVIAPKKQGTFHVFDLKDLFYLGSFGSIGKGPSELASSPRLINTTKLVHNNGIWVYDANSQRIKLFSLDNIFNGRTDNFVIKEQRVPDIFGIITNLFITDSAIQGSSHSSEGRFFIYPLNGSQTKLIPFPDSLSKDLSNRSKGLMFYSTMIEHSAKYVNVLWNFNVIEIYNQDFRLETKIIGSENNSITHRIITEDQHINFNEKRYYISAHLCDSLIFAIRHDVLWNQLFQTDYSSKILVFNWEGVLKYRFKFDHPITSLVYDPFNGRILASSYYGERSYFIYYTGKLKAD